MANIGTSYSGRAHDTLKFAEEEARRFKHDYIGTEHLLLGLLRVVDGNAVKVLTALGVDLAVLRAAVEYIIGSGSNPSTEKLHHSPRAVAAIELALAAARQMMHHTIGTDHLLLGLVREGEGIAAGVLEKQGATLERVRQEVMRIHKAI